MKNVTTTTMKDINRAINKKAAADLHNVNGIDWNTPGLVILHFEGSYTINKIVKELAAVDPTIPAIADFLILTCNRSSRWSNDRYHVTRANTSGSFEVERDRTTNNSYSWRNIYKIRLDDNYRKADFNEARKSEDCDTFVIYQPGGYKYPANVELDVTIRHNVKNIRTCSYRYYNDNTYTTYIDGIEFTDGTTYRTPYKTYEKGTEAQIIDKNGYIIAEQKQDYKRRAQALRAEREKAAAAAKDYSVLLADLKTKAAAAKAYIVAALTITDSPKEIEAIGDKLWRYNGLAGVYRDIGRLEGNINNKELTYPAEAEERAAAILGRITAITGQA